MYPCNKNLSYKLYAPKTICVCKAGENCIVVIRFNSLINPICAVGAGPIIRAEVMQLI